MVLTTALFGQTVFGIKSAAVLWALGWNLLWVRLILDMYGLSQETADIAGQPADLRLDGCDLGALAAEPDR